MKTTIISVHQSEPEPRFIAQAAAVLRAGGLVAFPTETVYGLGANALDPQAVARIFVAKGRPATNPIIVHVADVPAAKRLVTAWPDVAERLAERFWPGPLSLVLSKCAEIPDLVTAGGPTVAIRVPAHPVALALIRAADVPVAAPSANRSTTLSPTRAEHVLRGLDGRIDLLFDGGPTPGGLESTVLDVTVTPPRLLRPGLVGVAELREAIGELAIGTSTEQIGAVRSPGQMERHYAPRTPTEIVAGAERVRQLTEQGNRVGWLTFMGRECDIPGAAILALPAAPAGYAAELYAALHTLDAAGLDRILIDEPPATDDWLAIRDRLQRAAK